MVFYFFVKTWLVSILLLAFSLIINIPSWISRKVLTLPARIGRDAISINTYGLILLMT